MYHMPIWYFNTSAFYATYPHKYNSLPLKAYYLLEASYWLQQAIVLVLQLEKPRKDFKELIVHHLVTLSLIGLSWRFHFSWIGLAVFITMDVSDTFLALSKSLNYLGSSLTTPCFILFLVTWIYGRHLLNLKILYSVLTEFRTVGPYGLDWAAEQYKCWFSLAVTATLLTALQAVNAFWTTLIARIAMRIVITGERKDDRSDEYVANFFC